jgi:hypothetical protein
MERFSQHFYALCIPRHPRPLHTLYSLLPETAMAHGISQVPQQKSMDRIQKERFSQHFYALCIPRHPRPLHPLLAPPRDSHGTWYIPGPSTKLCG